MESVDSRYAVCGAEVRVDAEFCGTCGNLYLTTKGRDSGGLPLFLILMGALALGFEFPWRLTQTNWLIVAAGLFAIGVAIWLLLPKKRRRIGS